MHTTARFPDLGQRSVFITGGASGIGAALTEGFVAQGARVAFVDILDGSGFASTLAEKYGVTPLAIKGDVTDAAELEAALAEATRAHGPVTVLVNNAANDQRYSIADTTPERWDAMMAVNLRAQFFAARAVAPAMTEAGGGAIVNFSSVSYMMGLDQLTAYTTAKGGITAMSRSLARELGPAKIRVNAVAPGWVLTERQMELWASPEGLQSHLDRQCLKEHMTPDDMVGPVLFLASDASAMMTGQCLVVDAGVATTG